MDFESKLAKRLADQVLQPRRPTLVNRMRDWWYDAPYARPAVTSGLALAAMLPVAYIAFGGLHSAAVNSVNAVPTPTTRVTTASAGSGDGALEQIWAEHTSSDPLGDNSGLLLTPTSLSVDGGMTSQPASDSLQSL